MMNEPISSIMTKDVLSVKKNDTVQAVADILFRKGVHHIPVVNGSNRLEGIITSFDLLKLKIPHEKFNEVLVKDVMTSKVATLEANELIGAAAQIFLKNLFHGIPIVNEDRELLGIVTTHDILKYEFKKEYPEFEFENWGVF